MSNKVKVAYVVLFFMLLLFFICRFLNSGDYAETVCGSPLYMAPEMLGFQRYDYKVRSSCIQFKIIAKKLQLLV